MEEFTEATIIIKTFFRGEDRTKAPEKEIYVQLDKLWKKAVWAFKYTNPKGKTTVYRSKNDTEEEKKRLEHVLRTGEVPNKGNIYHPENRTLRMPLWLGRYKFTNIGHVKSK